MVEYQYKAKDINGKLIFGQVQAEDEQQAYEEVKSSGWFVIRLKEIPEKIRTSPLKSRHLADFSTKMSAMLESGITLTQAINLLVQKERDPRMAHLYRNVYHHLLQGYLLSEALELENSLFPPLLISMVRAGEEGGQLGTVMQELADYYEKDYRLKKKIEGAMMYPAFLGCLIVASLITLFTAVLPSFYRLFEGKVELSGTSKALIWISRQMRENGHLILLALAISGVLMVFLFKKPKVRYYASYILLKIPLVGTLCSSIYTARFARTLSTLYGQGISLIKGVCLAIDVVENGYLEKQLKNMVQDMCDGVPLSAGIAGVDGLKDRLADSIFIGEETGEMQQLLEHVSDSFSLEAEEALKQLLTLIEPVMIVIMAAVIGFIMFSVMTPLLQYYGTMI